MADTYTKKPVDIEALRFNDWGSAIEIMEWGEGIYFVPSGYGHPLRTENEKDRSTGHILDTAQPFLVVKTLEGLMRANRGDYIIKGIKGEFYPCKPDIFASTYDKKED